MILNFLTGLLMIGIFIASLQDLKRREVDNYINFFLLCSGAAFVVFSAILNWNYRFILFGVLAFVLAYLLANIFYYGRVFAGGDAKLLIALFPIFITFSITGLLLNAGIFVFLLMLAGSVYGVFYNLFLVAFNFSKFRKQFLVEARNKWIKKVFAAAIVIFIFGYFWIYFMLFSIFLIALCLFFVSGKAIEKSILTKKILAKNLVEGDWIISPIKLGSRTIRPDWEGVTKADLGLLARSNKQVYVRDGIPFVPAFFIAFLMWIFQEELLNLVLGLI